MNYDSICTYSSSISNSISNQNTCKQVSKGILEKGLRTAIVALIESSFLPYDRLKPFRPSGTKGLRPSSEYIHGVGGPLKPFGPPGTKGLTLPRESLMRLEAL
jgi:hypothetical protein